MRETQRTEPPLQSGPELEFAAFVERHERSLREALSAAFGVQVGRDATADAMVHAWERWARVSTMDNPVGYLYVVGRNRARRALRRRAHVPVVYPIPTVASSPSFEPALVTQLARLSERERCVVVLLHGFQWTMSEVAATLDVSKSTVQSYSQRAMEKLRTGLGVTR